MADKKESVKALKEAAEKAKKDGRPQLSKAIQQKIANFDKPVNKSTT